MPGGIHPPIEVILTWPPPNYDDPVTRPMVATMLACIFGPITFFLVFARLWVRIYIQRNPDWDDWLMLAAVPWIVALTIIIPLSSDRYRFNRHVWDVQPHYYVIERKFVLAIETTFCVATGLVKISILLFYRRLSSRAVSNTFKWTTWISIGFIAAYSIAFTLVPIFGCKPITAFWEQSNIINKFNPNYKYTCFDEAADIVTANTISTAQDLLTAILPTFIYWNLQIPFRQKVALFFIFAIAYGVVALGALRLRSTWEIFYESYDVTWVGWELWIWTLLEVHVGVMCANAPALKAFFRQFLKIAKSSQRSTTSRSNGSRSMTVNCMFFPTWHSGKEYISEPYTKTTDDEHSGVRIRKEIQIEQSYHSTDPTSQQRDQNDVELEIFGNIASFSHSRHSDEEALTALPPVHYR